MSYSHVSDAPVGWGGVMSGSAHAPVIAYTRIARTSHKNRSLQPDEYYRLPLVIAQPRAEGRFLAFTPAQTAVSVLTPAFGAGPVNEPAHAPPPPPAVAPPGPPDRDACCDAAGRGHAARARLRAQPARLGALPDHPRGERAVEADPTRRGAAPDATLIAALVRCAGALRAHARRRSRYPRRLLREAAAMEMLAREMRAGIAA